MCLEKINSIGLLTTKASVCGNAQTQPEPRRTVTNQNFMMILGSFPSMGIVPSLDTDQ